MSWLSRWTGKDDQKNAERAEAARQQALNQQQEMFYQQLLPWQYAYMSGYLPQMQYMQGLQAQMLGMPSGMQSGYSMPSGMQSGYSMPNLSAINNAPLFLRNALMGPDGPEKQAALMMLYNINENPNAKRIGEKEWNDILSDISGGESWASRLGRAQKKYGWQQPPAGWGSEYSSQPAIQPEFDPLNPLSPGAQGAGLPWWLNVPQGTADLEPALSTLSDLGMQNAAANEAARMAQYNAQRGIQTSAEQAQMMPGFNRWYNEALSAENARKALMLNDIATQRRGEMAGNFFNLGQYGQGLMGGATAIPAMGMNLYGNIAGMYNQNAQQYRQQASAHSPVGDIFGIGGFWAGGGFRQPQVGQLQQPQQPAQQPAQPQPVSNFSFAGSPTAPLRYDPLSPLSYGLGGTQWKPYSWQHNWQPLGGK